jgi:hypothetical protein
MNALKIVAGVLLLGALSLVWGVTAIWTRDKIEVEMRT